MSASVAVPILMYHSLSEQATPAFRTFTLSPQAFRDQMAYLAREGYTPLTVSAYAAAIRQGGEGLPPRPVVLTFDDGYADFASEALPVLRQHGFAATLYVCTAYVGGTSQWMWREGEAHRPMLTWAQIAEARDAGIEIGAHSHTHPQLDTLPGSHAGDEITRCKALLEKHLGQTISTFAYPFGYYDATTRRLVQAAGYTSACADKTALSAVHDDPFGLARVIVHHGADLGHFAALLAGQGLRVAPARPRFRTQVRWALRRARVRMQRLLHLVREPLAVSVIALGLHGSDELSALVNRASGALRSVQGP